MGLTIPDVPDWDLILDDDRELHAAAKDLWRQLPYGVKVFLGVAGVADLASSVRRAVQDARDAPEHRVHEYVRELADLDEDVRLGVAEVLRLSDTERIEPTQPESPEPPADASWITFEDARGRRSDINGDPVPAEAQPAAEPRRDPNCVAVWPHCRVGAHNPACCNFPEPCTPMLGGAR